jgi:glycolate oxidase FAD binding subunit
MTIDDVSPVRTIRPDTIDELSAALAAEKGAVVPLGACTETHFGNPLRRADCAIDLTRLSRITEYNPADLTIHAEAGVTLGQLQQTLLANSQFLPLDPWNGPSATIGGIAATNAQGPFRATGTIRDWIIGMKVVHVDGRLSKTGGRVVKNVTGYDLAKLYTGSIGSLVVIAEISFKLRARFGKTATAIAQCDDAGTAAKLITAIRNAPVSPVCCEWVNFPSSGNAVWVRFGEHPAAVDWQVRHLPAADWKIVEGFDEAKAWETLRQRYQELGPAIVRVVGPPTAVDSIIRSHGSTAWIAHALTGIVLIGVSSERQIRDLRGQYRVVIEKAPLEMRRAVGTFAPASAEYVLMKKMKESFDPEGRLNPGRHIDGETCN